MVTVKHLYLSPHLDDAVLSCGGLIHRQRAAGDPVAVMNLCAGSPGLAELSPLARQYLGSEEDPRDVLARRRAEDRATLARLGVISHYCDTPLADHRQIDGKTTYPSVAALYGEPDAQELDALPRIWQQELERVFGNSNETILYAPLAVGNHMDHQLARVLGWRLLDLGRQVWFYEDYPYIEWSGQLEAALAWFGPTSWQVDIIPIDVMGKIAAIRGYETQVPILFRDELAMARRVKRFSANTACGISFLERVRRRLAGSRGRRERLWRTLFGYHAHAERLWTSSSAL